MHRARRGVTGVGGISLGGNMSLGWSGRHGSGAHSAAAEASLLSVLVSFSTLTI